MKEAGRSRNLPGTIYLFSGLGADERVFCKLDFSGYRVNYIRWIKPEKKETIKEYTTRLLSQVIDDRPVLVGLSFGGLIAIEAAKQMDTEKVILLASAKTRREIPFYYRIAGLMKLHKLLPVALLKQPTFLTNWFFGATSATDKELLQQILAETDPAFLAWAIDRAIRWTNTEKLHHTVHIHGTKDRILPSCFIDYDIPIENGGHLMTLHQSAELSRVIREILNTGP